MGAISWNNNLKGIWELTDMLGVKLKVDREN